MGKLCKIALPIWLPAFLLSPLGFLLISVSLNSLLSETKSQASVNLE